MSSFTEAVFRPLLSVEAKAPAKPALRRSQTPVGAPTSTRTIRARLRRSRLPPGLLTQRWQVVEGFEYACASASGPADRVTVPAGYAFDGASVPWPLTTFVPRAHPLYLAAAAAHDWMYERGRPEIADGADFDEAADWRRTRRHADAVLREAIGVLGLHWLWGWTIWKAVRMGGFYAWYRNPARRAVLGAAAPAAARLSDGLDAVGGALRRAPRMIGVAVAPLGLTLAFAGLPVIVALFAVLAAVDWFAGPLRETRALYRRVQAADEAAAAMEASDAPAAAAP